eukprot:6644621-Lingulodinium_polyedra.AAC.1
MLPATPLLHRSCEGTAPAPLHDHCKQAPKEAGADNSKPLGPGADPRAFPKQARSHTEFNEVPRQRVCADSDVMVGFVENLRG